MESKTYYFKKCKGVDGLRWYFVDRKEDIPYLGGLNSKYTAHFKGWKDFMAEYHDIDAEIVILE